MKRIFIFVLLTSSACAQWIVNDPVNTSVNTAIQAGQAANHLEILRQWAEQLEKLNRQLRQLEGQLAVQQRIRDVMGDPSAAGVGVVLRDLGQEDLSRTYGETFRAAWRLSHAIDSLRRTSEGIYQMLDNRTVLGREFARQDGLYRRYAAVERLADTMAETQASTATRSAALQSDIAATLEQMRTAATQAEVDKLAAKLGALNAQLAHLASVRAEESAKLQAQQILNENQAAKERQDLLERQLAEERQSLSILRDWQEAVKVTPTRFSRP